MCFTSDKKPRIKTVRFFAKTCYKIVQDDLRPLVRIGEPYEIGKLTNALVITSFNKDGTAHTEELKTLFIHKETCFSQIEYNINEGIHSYKNRPKYVESWNKIIKCKIPIGAKYCSNGSEFVSTAIIPVKIMKNRY